MAMFDPVNPILLEPLDHRQPHPRRLQRRPRYPDTSRDTTLPLTRRKARLEADLSQNIALQHHVRRVFEVEVPTALGIPLTNHPELIVCPSVVRSDDGVCHSHTQIMSGTHLLDLSLRSLRTKQRALELEVLYLRRSILSPIRNLPAEVPQEVFRHTLVVDGSGTLPHGVHSPLRLLHVCRRWRDVAITVGELWTSLRLERSCPCKARLSSSEYMVHAWAHRSRNQGSFALRLIFTSDEQCEDDVAAFEISFYRQLDACATFLTSLTLLGQPYEYLTQLPKGLFPVLENLALSCRPISMPKTDDQVQSASNISIIAFQSARKLRRLALGYGLLNDRRVCLILPPVICRLTHLIMQVATFGDERFFWPLSDFPELEYLHVANNTMKIPTWATTDPYVSADCVGCLDSLRVLSINPRGLHSLFPQFMRCWKTPNLETQRLCEPLEVPSEWVNGLSNLRTLSYNASAAASPLDTTIFAELPPSVETLDLGLYQSGYYEEVLECLSRCTREARDRFSEYLPNWQVLILDLADTQVEEEGQNSDCWDLSKACVARHDAVCASCDVTESRHPDAPISVYDTYLDSDDGSIYDPVIEATVLIELIRLRTIDAPPESRLRKLVLYATQEYQVDTDDPENAYLKEILDFCETVDELEVEIRMIPGGRENKPYNPWSDRDPELESWDGVQDLLSGHDYSPNVMYRL